MHRQQTNVTFNIRSLKLTKRIVSATLAGDISAAEQEE